MNWYLALAVIDFSVTEVELNTKKLMGRTYLFHNSNFMMYVNVPRVILSKKKCTTGDTLPAVVEQALYIRMRYDIKGSAQHLP
jgi:hypothetical protein